MSRIRRWWTEEEDRILRQEAHYQLNQGVLRDWNRIAAKLPGRTNKDCRKRWSKVCDNIKKGAWSATEDEQLRRAVDKFGFRWTNVAEQIQTRQADRSYNVTKLHRSTADASFLTECAKRWYHSLDPNLDRREWEQEDDERLLVAVESYGRKWKMIREKEFPLRSSMDIKNRHVILERRKQNEERTPAESDAVAECQTMCQYDVMDSLSNPGDAVPSFDAFSEADSTYACTPSSLNTISSTPGDSSMAPVANVDFFSEIVGSDYLDPVDPSPIGLNACVEGNLLNIDPALISQPPVLYDPSHDRPNFDTMAASRTEPSQRSTLILEDVDPDMVGEVMKVLFHSNHKVKMQLFSQ